ncbi:hypothetical protein SELMODRAFT_169433 [Selaginella moellendorffii]|uniref:Mitochondrial carrier protein n=1 Tax=Selaginella moellendorffii TaxID=88036 RepID=D8RAD4_SELML|nr:hypothetical protein SELMODRAFT_169433 [Selaginella moellendorffii]
MATDTASELRERVPLHKNPLQVVQDRRVEQQQEDGEEGELGFRQHMLAGSLAGIVEHVAMFPVDTLKTRIQMITSPCGGSGATAAATVGSSSTISRSLVSLLKHEGPLGLYRGVGAMVLGAGPSHAVYFAAYEECKRRFEVDGGGGGGYHPIAHMSAGACATIASDAVSTPMDVVKQRLQLKNSPYAGLGDCVRKIARSEGLRGFYASYRTTVVMNVPFTGVHFATYEAAKKALGELQGGGGGVGGMSEEHLVTHVVAGGSAGALASAVTTPLDVVKTRLQCQGVCGAERFSSSSVLEVARTIASHEGVGALFKGMMPRILFHTPAAAISWATYEAGKSFLQRWNG